MAIYKVTDTEAKGANPRLIKAASAAIAVRHVTADRFKAETITKVEDAADLMAKGIELETAGEALPPVEASGEQEAKETAQA